MMEVENILIILHVVDGFNNGMLIQYGQCPDSSNVYTDVTTIFPISYQNFVRINCTTLFVQTRDMAEIWITSIRYPNLTGFSCWTDTPASGVLHRHYIAIGS